MLNISEIIQLVCWEACLEFIVDRMKYKVNKIEYLDFADSLSQNDLGKKESYLGQNPQQ